MVLRRVTVDNSVRYIPKSGKTRENKKQSEQNQPISGVGKPNTRKQSKKLSQNNRKWVASGFGILK